MKSYLQLPGFVLSASDEGWHHINVRHQTIFTICPTYMSATKSSHGAAYPVLGIAFQEKYYWPQEMVSLI